MPEKVAKRLYVTRKRLEEAKKRIPSIPTTEAYVFDGKKFAAEKEKILKNKVAELKSLGVTPRLNVILTSKDPASVLYVNLKQKACERVGIEMELFKATTNTRDYRYLLNLLAVFNTDPLVHGIMIQLPLGRRYVPYKTKILEAINKVKDVDGLTQNSPYMPATVKGIIEIIKEAQRQVLMINPPNVFVVGSLGTVGKSLIKELLKLGYPTKGYDQKPHRKWRSLWGLPSFMSLKADIIVSATGVPGLVEERHVNKGAVVIDVGSPKGDVRFKEVKQKAAFVTPVPGGVGPVTIVSLLENVIEAAYNSQS